MDIGALQPQSLMYFAGKHTYIVANEAVYLFDIGSFILSFQSKDRVDIGTCVSSLQSKDRVDTLSV